MATFISLLRGINVGGLRKIRMADLRAAYEALGMTSVATYLQSGNVLFHSKMRGAAKVARLIEEQLDARFGFDVTVLIRTPVEFERIIEANLFADQAKKDPTKVHVAFLAARPSASALRTLADIDTGGDEFIVERDSIYVYCPKGAARTKLTGALFERKLEVAATARNWRTVEALCEMGIRSKRL